MKTNVTTAVLIRNVIATLPYWSGIGFVLSIAALVQLELQPLASPMKDTPMTDPISADFTVKEPPSHISPVPAFAGDSLAEAGTGAGLDQQDPTAAAIAIGLTDSSETPIEEVLRITPPNIVAIGNVVTSSFTIRNLGTSKVQGTVWGEAVFSTNDKKTVRVPSQRLSYMARRHTPKTLKFAQPQGSRLVHIKIYAKDKIVGKTFWHHAIM